MKKIFLTCALASLAGNLAAAVPKQAEKPKKQEAKKSESSCDSYAEFRRKQKTVEGKKMEKDSTLKQK